MVVITTYAMLTKKRDKENPTIATMKQQNWSVCIIDEVHKLPAQ